MLLVILLRRRLATMHLISVPHQTAHGGVALSALGEVADKGLATVGHSVVLEGAS